MGGADDDTEAAASAYMTLVMFRDHAGKEYAGIDRMVGYIATDPVVIHLGLWGFLGPEVIPPKVYVVTHRQVISREREDARKGRQ